MSAKGRGKAAKTVALVGAIHDILEEIQPATVRAVCYRLFVAGLIPDMSKASTAKVSRVLVGAREEASIPWAWVVDEGRQAERIATWSSPDEIVKAAARQYRKDFWRDQPQRVEVWSEKGTIRGTLAPVLAEYGVTLRVLHGFSSATALHDAAEEMQADGRPLTILYVGDYDPSGLAMSENDIPARLWRYGGTASIRRVALTKDDVTDLPSFDVSTKLGDTRQRWFVEHFGTRCWELDALPPPILRQKVKDAILEHINPSAWLHSAEVERAEVESMSSFLTAYGSISRQVAKYVGGDA